MSPLLDKIDKGLGILYKYEIHAFVLLLTGILVYFRGVHDQGQVIIGAALLVFKGKSNV